MHKVSNFFVIIEILARIVTAVRAVCQVRCKSGDEVLAVSVKISNFASYFMPAGGSVAPTRLYSVCNHILFY